MTTTADHVPDNNDKLKAALIEARAKLSGAEALIEHLQLVIAKMKRELFGPRSPPKSALALGIAFNELATNAVKYGALSNATGSILIEWTMETTPAGQELLLNWKEKNGPRSRHRHIRDSDRG